METVKNGNHQTFAKSTWRTNSFDPLSTVRVCSLAMVLYLTALVAVVVMGCANERGGICTVAAIEEIMENKFRRLLALFEASL